MTDNLTDDPVFVVGIWRSGTSLLYALLNQHPNIALLYEGDVPEFWPMFVFARRRSDWLARWNLYNGGLTRHHIAPERIPEGISGVKAATEAVCKVYAEMKGAAVWGCKSPSYYCSLPRLARVFPNARFIVIWRDLRDTCDSILRAGQGSTWFRSKGIIRRALVGYRTLRRDSERLLARGIRLHQLNYEDLVQNPVLVMSGICDFLGVVLDPRMASLAGADRSAIYDGAHHSQVKTEKISAAKRTSSLPRTLDWKLRRYLCLWREQSGGAWPTYPLSADLNISRPGCLERLWDGLMFLGCRCIDRLRMLAFCFAPMLLLTGYRGLKSALVKVQGAGRESHNRFDSGLLTRSLGKGHRSSSRK
jgi:hypothetical protein